ncbi:phosphoribosylaminoimidazolesuccinocarboxamide synthase [Candidatus Mycalebacterium sp.]
MPSADRDVVTETNFTETGAPPLRGKVRDIYDLGKTLLVVSTDRISAYDSILPTAIRGKGEALNKISEFWFRKMADDFPNHFISSDEADFPPELSPHFSTLRSRSMLTHKALPLPVECIVRGHICGSAWKEYGRGGTVCGIKMPEGLKLSQKLPEPIFTPSTKAPQGGRDMNITFERACEIAGAENMKAARAASLKIYKKAALHALETGIIIADTKFEFGVGKDGRLMFIDEMLTPDSSRFWSAADYKPGAVQDSFDKQFVRDYLDSIKWDRNPPAPALPPEVAEKTSEKYAEMARAFTL